MHLSILIPSVPERSQKLQKLLLDLNRQVAEQPVGIVEVLVLTDLRTMSLGEKRNRLMQIAEGEYLINLDDDDELTPDALNVLLPVIREELGKDLEAAEVIAYDQECTLQLKNGASKIQFKVQTSLDYENETPHEKDGVWQNIKRMPWHWCCFRSRIARQYKFIGRVDEDWQWLKQILPTLTRQRKIDQALHVYHFDDSLSLCLPDTEVSKNDIVYTLGKRSIYEVYLDTDTAAAKRKGGSVWKTYEEALAYNNNDWKFSVYGVKARWGIDTEVDLASGGKFHQLKISAPLIRVQPNAVETKP